MTDAPPPPNGFDARSLENPAQQLLRAEFASLKVLNQATIDQFDPTAPDARANIDTFTESMSREVEEEPGFAALLRGRMLRDLGISPTPSPERTPDHILYKRVGDDAVEIVRITRADGVKIPVVVLYSKEGIDYSVEGLQLLSEQQAEIVKVEIEDNFARERLNRRLLQEFDIDPEMTRTLTTAELRAMLEAHDQIQTIVTEKPDLQKLDAIRKKLVRAMLPATNFVKGHRAKKLPQLVDEYDQELNKLIAEQGEDSQTISEHIYDSERLERLKALNEQVRKRKRILKTSNVGATALLTTVGAGAGALSGFIIHPGEVAPMVGGAVGLASGLGIGFDQRRVIKQRHENVGNFTELKRPSHLLSVQIESECAIANLYLTITHPLF